MTREAFDPLISLFCSCNIQSSASQSFIVDIQSELFLHVRVYIKRGISFHLTLKAFHYFQITF